MMGAPREPVAEGKAQAVMPGVATPSGGEGPAIGGMPRPRVATPPPVPRPRVATPASGATPPMPRPRVATPSPEGTSRAGSAPPQPRAATPAPGATRPMPRPRVAVKVEEPERFDSTMLTPASQLPSVRWARGERPVGLEEGWTEEELVTTHYRPTSEDSQPISLRREPPPRAEPPASLVDAFEREGDAIEVPDAADRTEVEAAVGAFTVAEAPLPEWEVGAPVALAEIVDTDAGLRPAPAVELELDLPVPPVDRTMLGPRPPAVGSLATSSPGTLATEADDSWLEPVRTGKTMVVHVQDLIAACAPPVVEPELDLDLPEDTAPTTAPTTAPRLSDELQAALDRLRRREGSSKPAEGQEDGEAPVAAASGRRRRRPGATDVYAAPGRDDTQVRALYHAALATLGDPDRGDGS